TTQTRVETPSFVFARMSGSVAAEDMPRHSHETAYFFFVLCGLYASEARGAAGPCGLMSVFFNPSGTTHRDHFIGTNGQFLAVNIPRELEREVASTIPVSKLLSDSRLVKTMRAACRQIRTQD